MNVWDVMQEVAEALDTIEGLRVHVWDVPQVSPDAAIVDLPDTGQYDMEAYGADSVDLTFMIVTGKPNDRSSAQRLAAYESREGPRSVKRAVDRFLYQTCDDVTVRRFEGVVATFGQVQYLGSQFTATVLAKGA